MKPGKNSISRRDKYQMISKRVVRREEEVLLRLRARRLSHLEERLRWIFRETLADQYSPIHLLAVGGHGVVLLATDASQPLDPSPVVVKFPLFDWTRPGKVTLRELELKRAALAREGDLLQRASGRLLPKFIASFEQKNPLVVERQPRIAPNERFLVMEWIDGDPLDISARAAAERLGRESEAFARWLAQLLLDLVRALAELGDLFPTLIYGDIAPRNFLLTDGETLHVVDAGSLVPRSIPISKATFTAKYCPLTPQERERPMGQSVVVRRLALMAIDLLSDMLSPRNSPDDLLGELQVIHGHDLVDMLAGARRGEMASLSELAEALHEVLSN